MERDPARELDLRAQARVRHLLLQDFRALERLEGPGGIAQCVGDRRQATHGISLAPQVVDLPTDVQHLGKSRAGCVPVVQVLVDPGEIM